MAFNLACSSSISCSDISESCAAFSRSILDFSLSAPLVSNASPWPVTRRETNDVDSVEPDSTARLPSGIAAEAASCCVGAALCRPNIEGL